MSTLTCFLFLTLGVGVVSAGTSRIGGGLHVHRTIGDLKGSGLPTSLSQTSYSIIGSYQYAGDLVKVEGDVDYIFNQIGTDQAMWEPSAWVLLGGLVYGGAGIGIGYTDGAWQDDPFYGLRAGVDLHFGTVALDVFATYRFQKDQSLRQLTGDDLDRATVAALVRFDL